MASVSLHSVDAKPTNAYTDATGECNWIHVDGCALFFTTREGGKKWLADCIAKLEALPCRFCAT